MKKIAVSQRVDIIESHNERRDALDQRWIDFLLQCGVLPTLVPNNIHIAKLLIDITNPEGILLTGGNTLAFYGGDAPERDETELFLLEHSIKNKIPVLGVCRGMQLIQHFFGVKLFKISNHIQDDQEITINHSRERVNSYHELGTTGSVSDLMVWAKADDGIVKAIKHLEHSITGIMWHPERFPVYREDDLNLFRTHFNKSR